MDRDSHGSLRSSSLSRPTRWPSWALFVEFVMRDEGARVRVKIMWPPRLSWELEAKDGTRVTRTRSPTRDGTDSLSERTSLIDIDQGDCVFIENGRVGQYSANNVDRSSGSPRNEQCQAWCQETESYSCFMQRMSSSKAQVYYVRHSWRRCDRKDPCTACTQRGESDQCRFTEPTSLQPYIHIPN